MAGLKMSKGHAAAFVGIGLLSLAAYDAGCSVPDRKFYDDTGTGGSSGEPGTAGKPGAGSGNAGAGGSPSGGMGTGADAGDAGQPSSGGTPGEVRPTPTKGLIVIGGTGIDAAKGELTVLAPETGKELLKEFLPAGAQIAGIGYDGADKKDVWYVFVGANYPEKPDKVVVLQVRYFDDTTNQWVTLSKITTLPPPVPGTIAVLNDRLAYLSHVGGALALTILDTSDVKAVKTITAAYMPPTAFVGDMTTLIGTRGDVTDATDLGGTLNLGLKQGCVGSTCNLFVQAISVGDSITPLGVGKVLGAYQGTPLAYASQLQQVDYYALSPASTVNVNVYRAHPNDTATDMADSFTSPLKALDLAGLTVAECQNTAAATATSSTDVYGVTLGAGAGKPLDLGRPGQAVAYEPFTRAVISTYNPTTNDFITSAADAGVPGPDISAVDIISTGGATLNMKVRTAAWDPPKDVRANVLVTRFPVPFKCP